MVACLCWLGSHADGFGAIRVLLNNYQANCPIIDGDHLAFGDDVHVEVLAGPVGWMRLPVLIATNRTGAIQFREPGFFDAGIGVLQEQGEWEWIDVTIRAWKGTEDFDSALKRDSYFWTQRTGSFPPNTNASAPVALSSPTIRYLWIDAPFFEGITAVLPFVRGKGQVEGWPALPYYCDSWLDTCPTVGRFIIHAIADPGSRFVGWGGFSRSTNEWLQIDYQLGSVLAPLLATFEPVWRLQVDVPFGGWVTNVPAEREYLDGTHVELSAIPRPNFKFSNWAGDLVPTNPIITLQMLTNTTLVAHFEPTTSPLLVIQSTGTGDGWVSNRFGFTLLGEKGKRYAVETSPDFTNWTPVTNLFASNTVSRLIDRPTGNRARFYRAVSFE